mmetsp:Transcript_56541/g.132621  ORF Transcript_56541/g.132621 Transcript_56541/m.132621 type:complete len:431 (-) Transcript_56541:35-1327(-)
MPTFHGCYLLESQSYKNRSYIGFTMDPQRRIRQHNGEIGAGARKTRNWRPWKMVLCIWGFPNKIAALQFEYAWQHPSICRHTKGAVAGLGFGGVSARGRQRMIMGTQRNMHVLLSMLQVLPYSRLPLQLHVLEPFANEILDKALAPVVRQLPTHLAITSGPFAVLEMSCAERLRAIRRPLEDAQCGGCRSHFKAGDRVVACLSCGQPFHVRCAASLFHGETMLVPQGKVPCSQCQETLEWPRLVQTARRLSGSLAAVVEEVEDEEEAEQSEASSGVEEDEDNMPLSQLGSTPAAAKVAKRQGRLGKPTAQAPRRAEAPVNRRRGRPPSTRGSIKRVSAQAAAAACKRRRSTAHAIDVSCVESSKRPNAPAPKMAATPCRGNTIQPSQRPAGKENSLRSRLHQRPGGDQLAKSLKCLDDVVLCGAGTQSTR